MFKNLSLTLIAVFLYFHSFSQNLSGKGNFNEYLVTDITSADTENVNEYLIIFNSPCLIEELNQHIHLKSAAIIQPIQSEHTHFISDLAAIRKSDSTNLKSGSIPSIKGELFRTINAVTIESDENEIAQIRKLDYVKAVLKNEKIKLENGQHSSYQYHPIKSLVAQPNTIDGTGVKVGIIDSGIDYNNPALGEGFGDGFKVAGGYDFVNNDNDPLDDDGHGTMVAGIIAADGDLTGIAPKATLYAYKVMNKWGWGWSNNVIKALERCVDPNQDFDLSDHLDVVNMSIAGYYSTTSLLSTLSGIYKQATGLKMTICVAAGNEGPDYSLINSLSISESVLCVGSCNEKNEISTFSCRSFGINDYGIKPDLVAIGENLNVYTLLNGIGTGGGTSAACPGVAGVAALLKQEHKDWTYTQIKSALINSTDDLGFNVMEQGAGRVNRDRATKQQTLAYPAKINWGVVYQNQGTEKRTYKIKIFNTSSEKQEYTFDFGSNLPEGFEASADVSQLSINPNDSANLSYLLTIDNDQLECPKEIPFNYFGRFNIYGNNDTISIPWTLTKGGIISFKTDLTSAKIADPIIKIFKNGKQYNSTTYSDVAKNLIVSPGKYDIFFCANKAPTGYPVNDTLRGYIYAKYNVEVNGPIQLDMTKKAMKNKIEFEGVDGNGKPLNTTKVLINKNITNKKSYTTYNVVGIKSRFDSLNPIILNCNQDEFFTNDIDTSGTYQVYAGEYKVDADDQKNFSLVNYTINQPINDTLKLKNSPESLSPFHFLFYPYPDKKSFYGFPVGHWNIGFGAAEIEFKSPVCTTLWIDKLADCPIGLAVAPMIGINDSLGQYRISETFDFIYPYGDSIQIKSIRSNGRSVFQSVLKADTVFVGNGPIYYSLNINPRFNYYYFGCYSSAKEMYGEGNGYAFENTSISIFDAANQLIYKNKVGKYNDDPYIGIWAGKKIEMLSKDYFIKGVQGRADLKYDFKSETPFQYLSIQSLQFLNDHNQIRSAFNIGSSARLKMSLNNAGTITSVNLAFKYSNETKWQDRTFNSKNDSNYEDHIEVDLSDLLTKACGLDFKIEVTDSYGNNMTYTLEPAIVIGNYHQNRSFKINKIADLTVLKNTVVKKKLDFKAFLPDFNLFTWTSPVIDGSGTVKIHNDSVFITPSPDFSGKLTAKITGTDGQIKDSIYTTVYFNSLNDTTFYLDTHCQSGDLIGRIKTKYPQDNIHYYLTGDIAPAFSIDSLKGELFVKNKDILTLQAGYQYHLAIVGHDTQRKDTAQITICVKPKPTVSDVTYDILEGALAGTIVGNADVDYEGDNQLSFKLLSGNYLNPFSLNPVTGELSVASPAIITYSLHRKFILKCAVSDGIYTDEYTMTINVKTKPVAADYVFFATEGEPVGTYLGIVTAKDEDKDTLTYKIISGNTGNAFLLDSTTARLTVNSPEYIDFKLCPGYHLVCSVSDEQNAVEFYIDISVKTKPVATDVTFDIGKGTPSGSLVGVLKASDEDGDALTYKILSGNDTNAFEVDGFGSLLINNEKELISPKSFSLLWQVSDGRFHSEAHATINVLAPTSVSTEDFNPVAFFPNPTTGVIFMKNILHETKIEIYSTSGNLLLEEKLSPDTKNKIIDISRLHPGIYFLRFTCSNHSLTDKIVKI